ncbi:MAG: type II toxin-antitoxin system RelE/ParE family toxin [Clostridiales bacterium]|nr:type II toxin-antitoxin system RelE/ParE family toxin [Clostridiales bacterium]
MSDWYVEYIREALADLKKLDNTQQKIVLKAIQKVSRNPLPNSEGGLGKPLGNHMTSQLAGYQKITLKSAGLRVVYNIVRDQNLTRIIIISIRDDEKMYKMAQDRVK